VTTDARLVARVLAGDDRHAFATLVRRHQGALRAWLRKLVSHDAALADDLAQETFLLAYRKLGQFRGDAEFRTWLHRIAYSTLLMNRRKYRHEIGLGPEAADIPPPATANAEGPNEDSVALEHALRALSPAEYAAIVQCYYLDLSHSAAAAALGCPVGTVKTHILRAKDKLRRLLGRETEKEIRHA
jgi:RNA polymerase sigma-70 factor, ECF subfamily